MDFGANLVPFSLPKSTKILPKTDPKMHQIFDRFLHRFWLHLGTQLGAMLATFSEKRGAGEKCSPLPCWVFVIFRFFGRHGPLLAQFGLDFGRVWASILEVFGPNLALCWARLAQELAHDGLVGLCGAQRIWKIVLMKCSPQDNLPFHNHN